MVMILPSDEIQQFEVTVPAGTPKTAPVILDVSLPVRRVNGIHVHAPGGHLGLVGWRIVARPGVPVFPVNGTFIRLDNSHREYALKNQPDSGDWQVQAYNTGTQPHIIMVTFHADLLRHRDDEENQPFPLWRDFAPQLPTLPNSPLQLESAGLGRREVEQIAADLRDQARVI